MPTAAIIGGGVIGSAWASRFLLNGWDVRFHDPAPNSELVLNNVLDKARRWVPEVYDRLPPEGTLTLCDSIADAVTGAEWIQESTPERLEIKQVVLAEIQESCVVEAIVASSTSGFMPSELQAGSARREQILVAHPYNPVYLLPIVEVVPSAVVPEETVQRAAKDRTYWIDEIAFLEARLNGSQGDIDSEDQAACEEALKAAKANLAACQ